jgi:tetratricopeptide (TPR) repeat protein
VELMRLPSPVRSTSTAIAGAFVKLADLYAAVHRYDDALSNYNKAVNLYLSSDNSEVDQMTWSDDLIELYKRIVTICTEHTDDFILTLKYQLLQHECKRKKMEDTVGGAGLSDSDARYLAESYFSVADCFINTEQYVEAYKHLIEGLKYTQLSKEWLLQNGRSAIRHGNVYSVVPLTADDKRLIDLELTINEKEERLRVIEPLLEKS